MVPAGPPQDERSSVGSPHQSVERSCPLGLSTRCLQILLHGASGRSPALQSADEHSRRAAAECALAGRDCRACLRCRPGAASPQRSLLWREAEIAPTCSPARTACGTPILPIRPSEYLLLGPRTILQAMLKFGH